MFDELELNKALGGHRPKDVAMPKFVIDNPHFL
jgi:hypothetical protein